MVSVRLLGGASLHLENRVLSGAATQRHRLAMLAVLAVSHPRPVTRDKLIAYLWPDRDEEHARGLLKQSVHALRRVLGSQAILSAADAVCLNADAVECDVVTFQSALEASDIERTVSVYTGPFLDGFHLPDASEFEHWLDFERARLRRAYLASIERLADDATGRGDARGAAEWWRRLAAEEPYNGRVAVGLMTALDAAGDRAGALRHVHLYTHLLRQEFEAEPDEEVSAFAERFRLEPAFDPDTPPRRTLRDGATASVEPGQVSPSYPLVGRVAELARLAAAWEEVRRGASHFILIVGEAGIGKTRVGEEVLEWSRQEGIGSARTRSYAAEGRLAYGPVADWLRAPALRATLRELEPIWLAEIARLLPELRGQQPDLPSADTSGSWQRQRLFTALARAVTGGAAPLVLLIDDLQWCDQDTLEWLHYLLRFPTACGPLIVGTARSEEMQPDHPLNTLTQGLSGQGKLTVIELGALDASETAALAGEVAGYVLPPGLATELYQETEGHPLYVVESVRARLQADAQGSSTVSEAGDSAPTEMANVPPPVQAIIQTRLAQLSPQARRLAGLAATIGRDFTLDTLSRACAAEAIDIVCLDELCRRRIIRELGSGRFDFTHDRLREGAYAEIGPARRVLLHRRAAEALAAAHAVDPGAVSAQIAVHYERAGLPEQAIPFYQRAAEAATRVHANRDGIDLITRALELVEGLPDGDDRDRRELALRVQLCAPLRASQGWAAPELGDNAVRARALCERVGTRHERLRVMWELVFFQMVGGKDLEPALETAQEALRLALTQEDPCLLTPAHQWVGNNFCQRGDFTTAREYLERGATFYDRSCHGAHIALFGVDYGVLAYAYAAHAVWHLGYADRAAAMSQQALTLADELAHPFSRAVAAAYDAMLQQFRGDPGATDQQATAAIAISSQYGFPYYYAWGTMLRGSALAAQGRGEAGIEMMLGGLKAMIDTGAELRKPYYLSLLAEAYAGQGQVEQALAFVQEAMATSAATGEHWKDAELHRIRGGLLLAEGDESAAEAAFQAAIAVADRQQAKSLQLRAALRLGRLYQRQSRHELAQRVVSDVYGWFTEGLQSADLLEARALLSGS